MKNATIISPPEEKFSWTTEILKVGVNGVLKADAKHAQQIRQRISREVKIHAPEREFETDTKKEPGFIILKRTA